VGDDFGIQALSLTCELWHDEDHSSMWKVAKCKQQCCGDHTVDMPWSPHVTSGLLLGFQVLLGMAVITIVWYTSWLAGGLGCTVPTYCPMSEYFGFKSWGSGWMLKDIQQGWGHCARQCHKFSGFGVWLWLSILRGARVMCKVLTINWVGHVLWSITWLSTLLEWKVLIYWES